MSKRSLSTLLACAALTVATALAVPTATVAAPSKNAKKNSVANNARLRNTYIVRLADAPVADYKGGKRGLAATKPAKGRKIDALAPNVVNYMSYLTGRHDASIAAVGGARKLYSYGYVFNGYAAELSEAQAEKLKAMPGVISVSKNELHEVDTSSTPKFLGLDAPGGIWEQLGGVGSAGEDIVIGVVDSGIWPESLSFSDRVDANGRPASSGTQVYHGFPDNWGNNLVCKGGEQFQPYKACNKKLIGARFFNESWGGNAGITALRPWEFNSPRDYNGHGTHTASTAGGNANTPTTGPAAVFQKINGIAPRARIAAYKALWSTEDASGASGFTVDIVAAIDQAVADGVDVINYSAGSGAGTSFLDAVEVAFLFAADAGVFVAASAGNDGPTTSTVDHPGPWVTTVAAGTHNRTGEGSVTLGDDRTFEGASIAAATGSAPFIDSTAAGLPGADPGAVALCFAAVDNDGVAVLDPAKVAGKIVLCDRGLSSRVNKSLAVKEAGGIGMVLANVTPNSLNADFHIVPSVHVSDVDRVGLKAYAATVGATAKINASQIVFNVPAPFTASFSSRGPLLAAGGDVLKPDIIAPGQDILAAVAPPGRQGLSFNLLSGTSMSSPHVAGVAALLKDLHPDWSPMAIKSALMTSATDLLDGAGGDEAHPEVLFSGGAGHVNANGASDPGLVYDSDILDWLGFLCGTELGSAFCTSRGIPVLDASNLNTPSIAVGDLPGHQTMRRRVTNVGGATATYKSSVKSMPGFSIRVTPSRIINLKPGETAEFQVRIARNGAAFNEYGGSFLTWTEEGGAGHTVRIPIVVRPVALAAPAEVSGSGGAIPYDIKFGYSGGFKATARGLVPAQTTVTTVADDPDDSACALDTPNAYLEEVSIPAGTTYARFSLFDEFTDGEDDLDLCVFDPDGEDVAGSGSGTSAEEANLVNPAAGVYTVVVAPFETQGPNAQFTLFKWLLGSTAAGNMTVAAPTTATPTTTKSITLNFNGLAAGTKYLGSVAYSGTAKMPNPTIVRVDP